jgi:predicted membrane-bound mannosyltransferase/DNA-binding beta-propeller fold protein YncE
MIRDPENHSHWLQNIFARSLILNREAVFYIIILMLALFTRFYDLGSRVMSHDESLHTRFSFNLARDGDFAHTPLMHGPILFHVTALMYTLFGDNDFTSRLYPATLSVLLVMSPLLFRRWLRPWGSGLASLMLLISPLIMYYGRYIRHDTPSLLSAVLMIWAVLMYISGPKQQRRRNHWLYLVAATMIWNLGSKETSFIYIAIIGIFLLLYFLVRLLQHFKALPGKTVFYTVMMGVFLGAVMALGMYIVLDIIQFNMLNPSPGTSFWELVQGQQQNFALWSGLMISSVILLCSGIMLWVHQDHPGHIPWLECFAVLAIALVVCFGFVILEELSHVETAAQTALPLDPSTTLETAEGNGSSSIRWIVLIIEWLLAAGIFVFLFFARRGQTELNARKGLRAFWMTLDLFPEVDLIIVIGTLILPWSAAFIPYLMKASGSDYLAISTILPSSFSQFLMNIPNIDSEAKLGQFILAFLAFIPLLSLAWAIGLSWDWRRWLPASLIFHGIFVFFFTTVFTNMAGLGTGMYYSLGYWLEQQGERRGSQPQYYYLLVIMPFYEFLPVLGSMAAMFGGLKLFWNWRKNQQASVLEYERQNAEALRSRLETIALQSLQQAQALNKPRYIQESSAMLEEPQSANHAEADHENNQNLDAVVRVHDTSSGENSLPSQALAAQGRSFELSLSLEKIQEASFLHEISFPILFSWLALLNLIAYSLAGEKMPWLGTHLTLPLIFLTAWFFGPIFAQLDLKKFRQGGWLALIVLIAFLAALVQFLSPLLFGIAESPLNRTYQGLGAALFAFGMLWILRALSKRLGLRHILYLGIFLGFGILSFITLRSAILASFINGDYATEFLVYAHGAPAVKTVLEEIEELSLQTTDGQGLAIAYDNEVSWPFSWYFRNFTNVTYVGENPSRQNLADAVVVVVGAANRNKVEPILEDRYLRSEYIRLWWPMQDYFNLSPERLYNLFDLSSSNSAQIRQGIFEIWWDRDYSSYGLAVGQDFSISNWPVSDRMYVYVRRDIAALIWPYATGNGSVTNPLSEVTVSQCTSNWQAMTAVLAFQSPSSLLNPIGISISANGQLYVVEEFGHRISVFDADGRLIGSYGQEGSNATNADGIYFLRPNDIAIGSDGRFFVADTWNFRIQAFSPDFVPISTWGQSGTFGIDAPIEPSDAFWGPRAVAVDASNRIFVADTGNKRIRVYQFSDTGIRYLYDIGSGGSGEGQLDEPAGLALHPDGRLFVADTWNRRISVFTSEGVYLQSFPVNAWYEDQGNRPYIALDSNRELLYVTDPDAGRVLVYSTNGDCLGSFGQLASSEPSLGEFNIASGITVDQQGYVYVADSRLGRVLKFTPFPYPETNTEAGLGQAELTAEPEASEDLLIPEGTEEDD